MNVIITIINVILISLRELREIMIMDGSSKMGEVITLINRWILDPHSDPTEWSHGIRIIYRADHLNRYMYIRPPLSWSYGLYSRLWYLYSPPWLGHSLRTEKISMVLWFWGSVFWRSDYLNREKFVTLFKHFRGIFSLKKLLEVFLAEAPGSPLA